MRLAPLILIVLDGLLARFTARDLAFSRFLSVAPALAASTWSVAGTLGIGGFALATMLASTVFGTTSQAFTLGTILAVTLASSYASHVRQQRERTLVEVRSVAETAQKVLLRPVPRRLGPIRIELLYLAAAAQARIGGDFYEALRTPHHVRLIIGDVRGKGLPAVEVASVILGSFREAAHDAPDLPCLARRLERSMTRYSAQVPGEEATERFATTLLVEIPDHEPVARLVNCGHPAPLLLHGEHVRELEPTSPSPPINLAALLADEYHVDVVPFGSDDRLLLYTDGVTETRDSSGTFYPLTQRVREWAADPPSTLLRRLHEDLLGYSSGHLDDDIAALVAHRLPPDGPLPTDTSDDASGDTTHRRPTPTPRSPGPHAPR